MRRSYVRILAALATVSVIAFGTSTLLVSRITKQTLSQTSRSLRAVAETTSRAVAVWAEKEGNVAASLARDGTLRSACEALLQVERSPALLITAPEQARLRAHLAPHLTAHQYLGYFLVAPDGISLASTRDTNIGTTNLILEQGDTFARILAGETVFAPPQVSDVPLPSPSGELHENLPTMFIGTPVRDASDTIIAVLTLRLSPAVHLSPVFHSSAAWDEGMTYAFDRYGRVITEPRSREAWEANGILSPDTYAALALGVRDPSNPFRISAPGPVTPDRDTAAAGVNTEGYIGIDGERVFSAWTWIPTLQIGVQTERAESAALSPVYLVRATGRSVLVFNLLVILVLLLLYERAHAGKEDHRIRLETVFSTMFNGLVTLDGHKKILSWNRAAEHLTGFKESEVLGSDIREIMAEPWTSRHDSDSSGIAESRHRVSLTAKSGEEIPVDVSVGAIVELPGGQSFTTAVLADARSQIRAEEIERAREVAEQASQAKSKFLASMSHEIRTPLNVILGFAQILERDESLSGSQQSAVGAISRSGEHLLELINDVLEMAKIEAGQVVIDNEVLPLESLLGSLKEMFELRAETAGLHYDVQPVGMLPAAVEVDRRKVRQILINLLGNAFKFTKVGGIVVRAGMEHDAKGTSVLRFEVEDTGPGVPRDQWERIFRAFEQTIEGRRTQGGTGLGLAISRQLAQAMGGSLTLESSEGEGSTFILQVPAPIADIGDAQAPVQEITAKVVGLRPGHAPVRLLIVDDTETNRKVLVTFFSLLGIQTREAADGLEAIEAFASWNPTLILMDLAMPNLNGYEATKRIRNAPGGSEPTIIILSASSFKDEEESAKKMGADAFLRKPFRLDDLLAIIKQHGQVQWAYSGETSPEAADGAPVKDVSLTSLPEEIRQKLAQAARSCLPDEIRDLATLLAQTEPDIAAALEHWLSHFQFDRILSAVEAT